LSHSHGTLAHFCRYCIWRRGTHVEVKWRHVDRKQGFSSMHSPWDVSVMPLM
jgi:hypothetical protein